MTFSESRHKELEQFTRETGIRVKLLPSPESAREKLALWSELLKTGASNPDVYGIDVIWPRILNEYFIDLKPYFANELLLQFPVIAASYTVDNKLVALPYRADIGLLYYRTDLLRQYGYRAPPRTWDELEVMAARIQAGERAKGKEQFWGFVWQGAATEALTCNALEWQASEGGGQIIEKDKTVSVNNPEAIGAWRRAAHWVGSISPPSIVGIQGVGLAERSDRNLVLNGVEAMEQVVGRPKKIFIRSAHENSHAAIVEVRDHGTGFENPEKAFDAFFTTKEKGMGMGLAICRSTIETHQGRLWVAPSQGPGATVCFTIPLQED